MPFHFKKEDFPHIYAQITMKLKRREIKKKKNYLQNGLKLSPYDNQ